MQRKLCDWAYTDSGYLDKEYKSFLVLTPQIIEWRKIYRATIKFRKAVASGQLKRLSYCEICKRKNLRIEGHHDNYSKPYDVLWLCPSCHKIRHSRVLDRDEIERYAEEHKRDNE